MQAEPTKVASCNLDAIGVRKLIYGPKQIICTCTNDHSDIAGGLPVFGANHSEPVRGHWNSSASRLLGMRWAMAGACIPAGHLSRGIAVKSPSIRLCALAK